MEPRLDNAHEISRRPQLHNAHKYVDVGRVAVNKSEYSNPNHFTFPILETLFPFHIWFYIYAIDYLDSHFDHSSLCDLNRMTMGAEVEFVYNVLSFVHNFMKEMISKFVKIPSCKYIKCSIVNSKAAWVGWY
jgi:hypothetical protein